MSSSSAAAIAASASRSRSAPKSSHKLNGGKVVPWGSLVKGQQYDFYSLVPAGIATYKSMGPLGPVFDILQHETNPAMEGKKGLIMKNQVFFKHFPKLREPTEGGSCSKKQTRRRQSKRRGQTRRR